MRITWKDGLATAFAAAGAGLYVLWSTGAAATGLSTRALAGIVFALGWGACMSTQDEMAEVYRTGAQRTVPLAYTVLASVVGAFALVTGIVAIVAGSEGMLGTMVVAMLALWLAATVRHVVTPVHGHAAGHPAPSH